MPLYYVGQIGLDSSFLHNPCLILPALMSVLKTSLLIVVFIFFPFFSKFPLFSPFNYFKILFVNPALFFIFKFILFN